jgi:hypothetical protein
VGDQTTAPVKRFTDLTRQIAPRIGFLENWEALLMNLVAQGNVGAIESELAPFMNFLSHEIPEARFRMKMQIFWKGILF